MDILQGVITQVNGYGIVEMEEAVKVKLPHGVSLQVELEGPAPYLGDLADICKSFTVTVDVEDALFDLTVAGLEAGLVDLLGVL